jgi:hypothetical protein
MSNITKKTSEMSLVQVRQEGLAPMSQFRKDNGKQETLKQIYVLVVEFMTQMNLQEKTNKLVIQAIAEDVFEVGFMCSFEEIKHFFKELRKGKYGSSYQNINSEYVITALNKFLTERSTYFAQQQTKTDTTHLTVLAEQVLKTMNKKGLIKKNNFNENYRKWKQENRY